MHQRVSALLCLIAAIFFFLMPIQVYADTEGLHEDMDTTQEKEVFLHNISFALLQKEPAKKPILCFDVNDEGSIALGFQDTNNKHICVFSADGEFLYGYAFSAYGNYSVFWEGSEIGIFFSRGQIAITFDSNGDCTGFKQVTNNYDSYVRGGYSHQKYEKNGILYSLENDFVIGNEFGRLKVLYPDGTKSVFYDATSSHNSAVLLEIICIVSLILCVIWYIVRKTMKHFSSSKNDI